MTKEDRRTELGQRKLRTPAEWQEAYSLAAYADQSVIAAGARVYCFWYPERHAAKIGFTGNVPLRLQQLKTASGDDLVFWCSCPGGRAMEGFFHDYFEDYRKKREWFDTSDGFLLKSILSIALEVGGTEWLE